MMPSGIQKQLIYALRKEKQIVKKWKDFSSYFFVKFIEIYDKYSVIVTKRYRQTKEQDCKEISTNQSNEVSLNWFKMSTGPKTLKQNFFDFQISPKLNDKCCFDQMKTLRFDHLGAFDTGV